MIGQQRVIACKCTHPTPNSDVPNASDAHPTASPHSVSAAPSQKETPQPRKIRDPHLTRNE
jgi:hypothetical protein